MVDLLILTILVGAAVSAALEFIDMLFELLVVPIKKSTLKKIFVLPLNIGGAFLMHLSFPEIVIASLAAMLVSLCITLWLEKPTIITAPNPYRSGKPRSLDGLL